MTQIHKHFTTDQIKVLLEAYQQGHLSRAEIEKTLGINKTRFFTLLKNFRTDPDRFSINYERKRKSRLSEQAETEIQKELYRDKELIDNIDLPVYGYNYAALNDRLRKEGIQVSTTTIIKRAKSLGCYQTKKRKKDDHDQEVITSSIGDLIQHDASIHKWSPFAEKKWTMITSLDDHSRMLLYANLVESETSWAHIQAAQYLMQQFGIPNRYYVDNLRVFRFIQHRDSVWKNLVLGTDDVNTQWRQVLTLLNTDVVYALSPQAKGKIERPYRWLQERIVRTCALEHVETLEDTRSVLREEVHRYNYQQVHSTTQEIPAIRFEKARKENRSLFRPFSLPKPFISSKDVFCLRHHRVADGYRNITLVGHSIQIPGISPRDEIELHFIPDETKNVVEIRFWANDKLVYTTNLPLESLKSLVHF
jgi:hypothetical protein